MPSYARGENFEIELVAGLARCRVWRRPDLDRLTGARLAEDLSLHLEALTRGPTRALLVDFTDAPAVQGPRTQKAISQALRAWEAAHRPVALVLGGDPMQRMQVSRLVRENAPESVSLHERLEDGERWVLQRL